MLGIMNFIRESVRVMNVATRPRQKEFEKILKITGISSILIGLAGVIIMVVMNLIMQ